MTVIRPVLCKVLINCWVRFRGYCYFSLPAACFPQSSLCNVGFLSGGCQGAGRGGLGRAAVLLHWHRGSWFYITWWRFYSFGFHINSYFFFWVPFPPLFSSWACGSCIFSFLGFVFLLTPRSASFLTAMQVFITVNLHSEFSIYSWKQPYLKN